METMKWGQYSPVDTSMSGDSPTGYLRNWVFYPQVVAQLIRSLEPVISTTSLQIQSRSNDEAMMRF